MVKLSCRHELFYNNYLSWLVGAQRAFSGSIDELQMFVAVVVELVLLGAIDKIHVSICGEGSFASTAGYFCAVFLSSSQDCWVVAYQGIVSSIIVTVPLDAALAAKRKRNAVAQLEDGPPKLNDDPYERDQHSKEEKHFLSDIWKVQNKVSHQQNSHTEDYKVD